MPVAVVFLTEPVHAISTSLSIPSQKGSRKGCAVQAILILTGLLPLAGPFDTPPDLNLLIYSLFILVYLLRRPVEWVRRAIPLPSAVLFVVFLVCAGELSESLIRVTDLLATTQTAQPPELDLGTHLVYFGAFYAGGGLAWVLLFRFFRFTLSQVFVTHGFLGVLLEQEGAVFLSGLITMPLGLVVWLYTFLVYGSTVGIAYLLASCRPHERARDHWVKYPLAAILVTLGIYLTFGAWSITLESVASLVRQTP